MKPYHWTCPFCNRHTTMTSDNNHEDSMSFALDEPHGELCLLGKSLQCPHPDCKRFTLQVNLAGVTYETENVGYGRVRRTPKLNPLEQWELIPESKAKPFPEFIPKAIRDDYTQACRIVNLVPKASATMARRCIQGMIRDFWDIREATLKKEIDALKELVSGDVWEAIDVVRQIGNIGAHMEKDVDLIIDVDPDEAERLIDLIEVLFSEWYIARDARAKRLAELKAIGKEKQDQRHDGSKSEVNTE